MIEALVFFHNTDSSRLMRKAAFFLVSISLASGGIALADPGPRNVHNCHGCNLICIDYGSAASEYCVHSCMPSQESFIPWHCHETIYPVDPFPLDHPFGTIGAKKLNRISNSLIRKGQLPNDEQRDGKGKTLNSRSNWEETKSPF